MGNVGKWTGMNKYRCPLQCLHQVRFDGIFHQDSHRASNTQVLGIDCFTIAAQSNDNLTQSVAHIRQVGCKGKNCHNFRGDSNIKTSQAGMFLFFLTHSNHNPPQEPVAGVQHAPPGNCLRIDIQPA